MFTLTPYSIYSSWKKEANPTPMYIPKRSQKIKNKRLRAKKKRG